jgi:hypothetical protein
MLLGCRIDQNSTRSNFVLCRSCARLWRMARGSDFGSRGHQLWQRLAIALIFLTATQMPAVRAGFIYAPTYAVGTEANSVAVGDFNGDGIPDLAVAAGGLSILLGNGDGTFQAAREYAAGGTPFSVVAADFNGDGVLDIAMADYTASGTVSILLGNGDGTFQAPQSYAVGAVSIVLGDFNGDGIINLAVANSNSGTVSAAIQT